tara:strand:+ start:369 stop:629 length:261 start_codon:yes stop_codon:yes gene_type:complete
MAKNVKEYFKITDKEWRRTPQDVKLKKLQEYNSIKRKELTQKFKNFREDARSDFKQDAYGTKKLFKGNVRKTLEKAGYDIKRVRNK